MVRAHVLVSGQVQGVGFRAFACRQAVHHGLTGWVRNMSDGRVETEAQGSREAVERFLRDLKQGPSCSQVENLEVNWIDVSDKEAAFHVVY